MPRPPLHLIKRCAEYLPQEKAETVARGIRGIYVLFRYRESRKKYDVAYVGMARGGTSGVRSRLRSHVRGKKSHLWTHFSIFEVWPSIPNEEIVELEGLFRHIYRRDWRANRLNKQKGFGKLAAVRHDDPGVWGADQ
jgi:hypothetical protein